MFKYMAAAAFAFGIATPGGAAEMVKSNKSVPETMDALVAAVEGAGASVVARVNHAAAADGVGIELAPLEKLIFGNPKLGSQAMQEDPRAGLLLPMQVLVYEDSEGTVWLTYEAPADLFAGLDGVTADDEYLQMMTGALAKLTAKAAE